MACPAKDAARENYEFQRIIAVVGVALMIGKFSAYVLTDSVSILTDALESIVNVVAGFIGLYALYLSARPADSTHPYGHGKVELISSSVEGTLIAVAGAVILIESYGRLVNPSDVRQLDIGLAIVALAAAANFAMGWNAVRRGRRNHSLALEASGRHLCTDTYSSLGIVLGLGIVYVGDRFGLYDAQWVDPAMAAAFGAFIVATGARVLYRSMCGIMDRTDEELVREVTRCVNRARALEVIDVHHLRVVRYGMDVHVDVHMVVPDWLTVKRTDEIIETFRAEVYPAIGGSTDITVMAEPCHGLYCRRCPSECDHRGAEFVARRPFGIDAVTRGDRPQKRE